MAIECFLLITAIIAVCALWYLLDQVKRSS